MAHSGFATIYLSARPDGTVADTVLGFNMWHVAAEEDMYCTECHHEISSGTVCLSQMPSEIPEGFRRRKYENFCIGCEECVSRGGESGLLPRGCYVRRLDHWYTHEEKTAEAINCSHCGEVIPKDIWTVAQKFYAWPDSEADSESTRDLSHHRGAVTGAAAGAAAKTRAAGWHDLSRATQYRFQSGGLSRGLGTRSPTMGQRLYEKEVPEAIRNLGEPAVRDFLGGKHFSHIKSVANAPSSSKAPSNVILENSGANLSRGSRNMTAAGRTAARSASRASAVKTGARAAIKSGAKAGLIAAASEAIVSVPENILHYRRGRKSGEQAARDTAKSTATAAGVGIATAGVAKGAAMAGIGLSLGPLGTPLMVAGGVLVGGSAIYRIAKAARRDLPLDEYRVFFCKNKRCKTKFAGDITMAVHEIA